MSLMQKVQALISGIDDVRVRMEVASTIRFLADLYSNGRAGEDEIRKDLLEICTDVLRLSNPDLLDEEIAERAKILADEIFQSMRLDRLVQRTIYRYSRLREI
jgi:hypothetical protein